SSLMRGPACFLGGASASGLRAMGDLLWLLRKLREYACIRRLRQAWRPNRGAASGQADADRAAEMIFRWRGTPSLPPNREAAGPPTPPPWQNFASASLLSAAGWL